MQTRTSKSPMKAAATEPLSCRVHDFLSASFLFSSTYRCLTILCGKVLEQPTSHTAISSAVKSLITPTIGTARLHLAEGIEEDATTDLMLLELPKVLELLIRESTNFRRLMRETIEICGRCLCACLHQRDSTCEGAATQPPLHHGR
jgi:hypothetical protein